MISTLLLATVIGQAKPTVAFLPVLNHSEEFRETFRADMIERVSNHLPLALSVNGFEVISKEKVATALEQLGIDIEDEELHKRDTFYRVGEQLKSDYVLFTIIEENSFNSGRTGRVVLRTWFLQVEGRKRILSSKLITGESRQEMGVGNWTVQLRSSQRASDNIVEAICRLTGRKFEKPKERQEQPSKPGSSDGA